MISLFDNMQTVLKIWQLVSALSIFIQVHQDRSLDTEDLLYTALIATSQVPLLNIRITKCRVSFREGKDPFQINSRSVLA